MRSLFFLLGLCLACALHAAETPTLKLLQTIPLPGVKGRFDHFAIDTKGRRLFVAALGNNTLEVIDLAASKRLRSVSGMSKPTGVLYLPESNQVLVANGDDGTLKILSGFDYIVLHNLTGLGDADNLRLDAKTKLAWLGYGDGAFAIIDPAAAKSLAGIKLPAHPESFQLEPNGNRIFVNLPDAKQIAVVDRENKKVLAHWSMEKFRANFPMSLDAANHRLFLGCRKPGRLVIFDTAAGSPAADLAISGDTDDLSTMPAASGSTSPAAKVSSTSSSNPPPIPTKESRNSPPLPVLAPATSVRTSAASTWPFRTMAPNTPKSAFTSRNKPVNGCAGGGCRGNAGARPRMLSVDSKSGQLAPRF